MKTVFITSFHPLISRNILSTPLVQQLISRNIRVVVLCPTKKKQFFEKEFGDSGVVIEGIEGKLGKIDRLLSYVALAAVNTNSLRIKRLTEMKGSGAFLASIIGNHRIGYLLARLLNRLLIPYGMFQELLNRYEPSLIFATDIQNSYDIRLACEAGSKNIKTVGMLRSWDNFSTKGTLRFVPDKLLVNNEMLKREAYIRHGIDSGKIEAIGIPHYDSYLIGQRIAKDEFFRELGLDMKKRIVLFAPTGDRYINDNYVDRDIIDILDKNFDNSWQILVRLPPADTVSNLEKFTDNKRIIFDRAETQFATLKNNEISKEADKHLADSLYWCDLVVAGSSTICIDAAVFDKPAILAGFDGYQAKPYKESVIRFYDYDHWGPLLKSGGVPLAKSIDELKSLLAKYSENPAVNREARKKMLLEQCLFNDGLSTERVFNQINNLLI